MKKLLSITLIILLVLCLNAIQLPANPAMADPADIYVPSDYSTIQEAIDAASPGDTVFVAAGTYSPSTNGEVFPIRMRNGVSLQGAGAGSTIMDAENTNGVIACDGINIATTKIDGFTITNGSTNDGGGIYLSYSSVKISNNTITENNATDSGGGIFLYRSFPTISNNAITDNTARGWGGGISINLSSGTIANNIISGNSIEGFCGGGIYVNAWLSGFPPPIIRNNIITGNSAPYIGGGISSINASPTITNNIISNNSTTSYGGGIEIEGVVVSSPTIINNTIFGNNASHGGGFYIRQQSNPTISNNIIASNTASSSGGGIWADGTASPSIDYNDVWDNSTDNYFGCSAGLNDISQNPLFVNPAADDYHLQSSSPCIDIGDNTAASGLPTDFEGDPRIWDGDGNGDAVVDIGADEYYRFTATVDIAPDVLNLKSKGKWITVYIEFPQNYDLADINVSTIKLNDTVSAELKPASIGDYDDDGILDLMVKFDRGEVTSILEAGDYVEVKISGELNDGTKFNGTDYITVKLK